MLASWMSMTKIAGSGSESGSISLKHGSADPDPDPYKNVMDPQHCPISHITMKTWGLAQKRVLEKNYNWLFLSRTRIILCITLFYWFADFSQNLYFRATGMFLMNIFSTVFVRVPLLNAVAAESPGSILAGGQHLCFRGALPKDGENIGQVSS